MRLASTLLFSFVFASGCSSQLATPSRTAQQAASRPRPSANEGVEVRHFYLLSPGPNATLVVTRSDVPDSGH